MRIDDFLHFGYVGAPWKRDWEFRGVAPIKVGNGGLSLRQRSADFATLVGMRDARMIQHTHQARPLEMRRDSLLRQQLGISTAQRHHCGTLLTGRVRLSHHWPLQRQSERTERN